MARLIMLIVRFMFKMECLCYPFEPANVNQHDCGSGNAEKKKGTAWLLQELPDSAC